MYIHNNNISKKKKRIYWDFIGSKNQTPLKIRLLVNVYIQ